MGIKYYKGTQKSFEEIRHRQKFWKVTDIYIGEDGGLYYCVEDAPLDDVNVQKIETEVDNNKKILYNIIVR